MKLFVIAGEPSGDALGQAIMIGLKTLVPEITFEGIGGPLMEAQGLCSRFDMSELSLMGIAEIAPKYFHLKRLIKETAEAVIQSGADALLTIDSPDFCLRVAKLVRAKSPIRIIHYVAPSVWAWRPGRAHKMARHVDHVLALLPFEPPLMTPTGMGCDFVGHPIVAQTQATETDVSIFRQLHGLTGPTVLVLPGSRRSEITRLTPVFGAALQQVLDKRPDLKIIVPIAKNVDALTREAIAHWPGNPIVIPPAVDTHSTMQKRAAFKSADVALAASGTVSLELAAAGTPMVIGYDMNWLSRQIMQRMLLTDTVTLVNLVSDSRVVPEFIGSNFQPKAIAASLLHTLDHPDVQTAALDLTLQRLGRGGEAPGLRAAKALMAAL